MSIGNYVNGIYTKDDIANEGLFNMDKNSSFIKNEVHNTYKFGKILEETLGNLYDKKFYPVLASLKVPNKIISENEYIQNILKDHKSGHTAFNVSYPLLTWTMNASKEDDLKTEVGHLYRRLTNIVDLRDPETVMIYGNYHLVVSEYKDDFYKGKMGLAIKSYNKSFK